MGFDMSSTEQGNSPIRSPLKMNLATGALACALGAVLVFALVVSASALGLAAAAIAMGAVAIGPARRSEERDGSYPRAVAAIVIGGLVCVGVVGVLGNSWWQDRARADRQRTVDELNVGDCVRSTTTAAFELVPCDQRHVGEVVAVGARPRTDDASFVEAATDVCSEQLVDYIGGEASKRYGFLILRSPRNEQAGDALEFVCLGVRPRLTDLNESIRAS